MLTHIEEKVYRILWNDSRRNIIPPIKLLCSRTGRRPQEILRVLDNLERQDYIEWDPNRPDVYRVLNEQEKWNREWERKNNKDGNP